MKNGETAVVDTTYSPPKVVFLTGIPLERGNQSSALPKHGDIARKSEIYRPFDDETVGIDNYAACVREIACSEVCRYLGCRRMSKKAWRL